MYANCPPPQPSSADIPPVYVLPESPLASPLAPADSPIYFFPEAPTAYSPSYFPDPEAPAYSPIYFPPEAPATSPVYPPPVQEPTTPPVYTPPQTPSVPYNHGMLYMFSKVSFYLYHIFWTYLIKYFIYIIVSHIFSLTSF